MHGGTDMPTHEESMPWMMEKELEELGLRPKPKELEPKAPQAQPHDMSWLKEGKECPF